MNNINLDLQVYNTSSAFINSEFIKIYAANTDYTNKEKLFHRNDTGIDSFIEKFVDCNKITYQDIKYFINNDNKYIATLTFTKDTVKVAFSGNTRFVAEIFHSAEEHLKLYEESKLNWAYYDGGRLEYKELSFKNTHSIVNEMYPWLNCTVQEYYKKYLESDASILILRGDPGTGKTSFLKGLFEYSKKNAYFTFDDKILNDDSFFIQFVTGNSDLLIIEDCDQVIGKREDGNTVMSKLLNVSDGFVNLHGKKIIFTTNLPNISSIDEALLRKGRCYDTLNFRLLYKDEARALADKFSIDLPDLPEYTIADIFSKARTMEDEQVNSVGFVK